MKLVAFAVFCLAGGAVLTANAGDLLDPTVAILPSGLLAFGALAKVFLGHRRKPSRRLSIAILVSMFLAACCGLASIGLHIFLLARNCSPDIATPLIGAGNLLATILFAALIDFRVIAITREIE